MSELRNIKLGSEPVVVGRALRNSSDRPSLTTNLYLANNHISKFHAVVYREDGAVYIKDTGSTFGTILNNILIAPNDPHVLKKGDVLGLVVNRPANVVETWRLSELFPSNIPLDRVLNPWVHLQFDIDFSDDLLILNSKNKSTDEACSVALDVTDVTRTPEYEDNVSQAEEPSSYSEDPAQVVKVVSEDEAPEEVKFVKEIVLTRELPATELQVDVDTSSTVDKHDPQPEPAIAPQDEEDLKDLVPCAFTEPEPYAYYDEPSSEESGNEEVEPSLDVEESVNEEVEPSLEIEESDSSDADISHDALDTAKSNEAVHDEGESISKQLDDFSDEDLDRFGWNEDTVSESDSDENDFLSDKSDDEDADTSLSDAFDSCPCGVKRTYEEAELEVKPELVAEEPQSKKQRLLTVSLLKEVGKGALYVAGTVIALIAYGRSLENQ